MDIGKNYKDGMEVVNSYYKRIADYITSQKDGGYLTLEDSQNDTIICHTSIKSGLFVI